MSGAKTSFKEKNVAAMCLNVGGEKFYTFSYNLQEAGYFQTLLGDDFESAEEV